MQRFHRHFNRKKTPQSGAIPGTDQAPNRAGGFVWELGPWYRLDRFLILGTEGGTYYATEHTLTVEDARNVLALLKEDGPRVVARIVEVSEGGKAYKNAPALFALVLAFTHGDEVTKKAAEEALPRVARICAHLFGFLEHADAMRGWGRGLRRSVARWYGEMLVQRLAVIGMVSNGFSIADPNDAGMLDIVGMSTDTPNLISSFVSDGPPWLPLIQTSTPAGISRRTHNHTGAWSRWRALRCRASSPN